jgi:thymidylate kinase
VSNIEGVIFTGVYGAGKSSVVEEIASHLDQFDTNYAAIDVDWLWWFNNSEFNDDQAKQILFKNLKSVISNYLDAGVSKFLFAWAIRSKQDLETFKSILPFPVMVIGLTAPLSTIKDRIATDAATGRKDDLANTEKWIQESVDLSIYDAEISNNRPITEVAIDIMNLLRWNGEEHT